MRVIVYSVLLTALVCSRGAMAVAVVPPIACHALGYRNLPQFVVSAVLSKDSQDISIKLVHTVETTANEDTALGSFTRKVLAQYPGYSLLETLVSRVPASCEAVAI